MIAPDLVNALNAALRELLSNPDRHLSWLMIELDRLLPGDGPIVTAYEAGSVWSDPSRRIGRPRAIVVTIMPDGWVWSTSAGVSGRYEPAPDETDRLSLLIEGAM